MPDYAAFDRYVEEHMPAWTEELAEICRFPSEAVNRQALRDNAAWVADRLRRLGDDVEVDVVTIDGEDVAPLVLGEVGCAPGIGPSLVAVQHYDVQPAVPLELWTTPPYEPQIRDGRLFARGAADDKGELMARIWAVEAYRATIGELPCRVRFLVEGEEEGGGANLGRLLDLRPNARRADGALIEGGDIDVRGRPRVFGGVRGMVALHLVCRTIAYDAHSSLSNLLPSASVRMAQALATLFDADGAPAIEGLDTGVRPPSAAQLAALGAIPDEDVDDLLEVYGIDRFIGGLRGQDAIRRLRLSPTCNIQGLWSGYTGPGGKTITPAEAHARLDIRLVPDQEPAVIADVVRRHLAKHGFGEIELTMFDFSYRAWWTEPDHPIVQAAVRASESVLGKPAILDLSSPGTAPMHEACGPFKVPATSLGGSDDDVRVHAPDESFSLAYAAAATRMTARFFDEFAAMWSARRAG